jgi:hypothetical protein
MSKTLEELAEEYTNQFSWNDPREEDAQDAFVAGYKAAKEEDTCEHILDMSKMVDVNGWISVKDRLPEKEGEYLAFGYSASDAARWIVVMYDPKDECWYELSSDWDWTDDVTHWQELPKPPKEEE